MKWIIYCIILGEKSFSSREDNSSKIVKEGSFLFHCYLYLATKWCIYERSLCEGGNKCLQPPSTATTPPLLPLTKTKPTSQHRVQGDSKNVIHVHCIWQINWGRIGVQYQYSARFSEEQKLKTIATCIINIHRATLRAN